MENLKTYGIIYCVVNIINKKKYIGKTTQKLEDRKQEHFLQHRLVKKNKKYLYNSMQKYGWENFIFYTVDRAKNKNELNFKEKFWIKKLNTFNKKKGYNRSAGGDGGWSFKRTKKHKEISRNLFLKMWDNTNFRNTHNKGKNNPMYGKISPMKGKHLSLKHKRNISKGLMGHKASEKQRNSIKIIASQTKSNEHRKHLSLSKMSVSKKIIKKIRKFYFSGKTYIELSKIFQLSYGKIYKICNYKYKYER